MKFAINIARRIKGQTIIIETILDIADEADAMRKGTRYIASYGKGFESLYWDWAD